MISTVEVIEKSKAISDIGLEIQTLNNAYANHAKAMQMNMTMQWKQLPQIISKVQ